MVDHLVLFRFRPEVSQQEIRLLFEELRGLASQVDGICGFRGGAYSSPEGLNQGFSHGFVMTFQSPAARDAYLPHPAHQLVVEKILPMLEGGLSGVVAFDLIDGEL
ncbi:MAG: Dabb family protein [Cyanobium sp.]